MDIPQNKFEKIINNLKNEIQIKYLLEIQFLYQESMNHIITVIEFLMAKKRN